MLCGPLCDLPCFLSVFLDLFVSVSWFMFLLFRFVFAIRCQILASVLEQAGARLEPPLNLQIYPTMECLAGHPDAITRSQLLELVDQC